MSEATPDAGAVRSPVRVLVVDDERVVCDLARSALTRAGFEVRTAANGPAALAYWDDGDPGFALVLADVMMPHMNGARLLEELRRRGHAGPVVLMSGESAPPAGADAAAYLAKPFRVAELVAVVRRLTAR